MHAARHYARTTHLRHDEPADALPCYEHRRVWRDLRELARMDDARENLDQAYLKHRERRRKDFNIERLADDGLGKGTPDCMRARDLRLCAAGQAHLVGQTHRSGT